MYERNSKRFVKPLIEGENSVFKETKVLSKRLNEKKENLPKPVLQKRLNKDKMEAFFYGILTFISIISMGMNLYFATFMGFVSSVLATVFSLYCLLYTNPDKWWEEKYNLAFWNASVTMSVLLKSIHFRIFQWRKILMFAFASGLTISYFLSISMIGVFGAFFLLSGLFFFAERDLEVYSKIALVLAWISVPALILSMILTKTIPLGLVVTALLLYQTYERVKYLKIVEPWIEEQGHVG